MKRHDLIDTHTCSCHPIRSKTDTPNYSQVVRMGEDWQACPYYASRDAVGFAQLVCAPYNIILQADMRNSMGLRLKGVMLVSLGDTSH